MSYSDSFPHFTNYDVGDILAEAAGLSGQDLIRTRTPKALGELAELAFAFKAASLGFGVSKPLGDNQPFDFILNAGHRLWKVQVKSTYHIDETCYFNTVRASVGGRRQIYSAENIDVLAGWVMPLDIWYIIPVRAFAPRTCAEVYPHRPGSTGQYEPFREAWCQLACSGGRRVGQSYIDRPLPGE
jgi:PD-(D/E)XK endonuclease